MYEKKLQNLLDRRGLKKEDLPKVLQRLEKQAKLVNSKRLTVEWDVGLLQKELEGEFT